MISRTPNKRIKLARRGAGGLTGGRRSQLIRGALGSLGAPVTRGGDMASSLGEARRQGWTVAYVLLLALAALALVGWLVGPEGLLSTLTLTGYLGAWVLGLIAALAQHRWLWLLLIALVPPSAIAFALIGVAEAAGRTRGASERYATAQADEGRAEMQSRERPHEQESAW
jgi:hypothetical protein